MASVEEFHEASTVPMSPAGVETTSRDHETTDGAHHTTLTVIEPSPGWKVVDLAELWRHRELLVFLIWRDVMVRYKQTVLGAAWAVLQPLATMVVFSLFFGRVAGRTDDTPYPLFVLAGLVPWVFFSNAISAASQSIVSNQSLVTKVYFPRLMIPMGAVAAGLVDLAIAFGLLIGAALWYGVTPGWRLAFVPLITLGLTVSSLGVGTLLSALTVAYRDFRYVVPFMVQLWMFATPSIYLQSGDLAHSRWHRVLPLNPAEGLISAFREATLGKPLNLNGLALSSAMGLVFLLAGTLYFRRVERTFADVI
jgi:lipopolysaccharide transport system permease protein